MMTGNRPTGSSTPPIWAAAEMWQLLPTWAQLPTSACESITVPSPTQAPALMYMGGIQMTPLPIKQPSRMLEPPGTRRMPSEGLSRFTGQVALSNMGVRTGSGDIFTTAPMRRPDRMPFLTQMFTRQPLGVDPSGSAERIAPRLRASLNRAKSSKSCSVNVPAFLSNRASILVCMRAPGRGQEAARPQNGRDLLAARFGGRSHGQSPHRLQQAHHGHGAFHRNGVGLHEIHFHQR